METLQRNNIEQLLDNFEVEELENRMEFVTWTVECHPSPVGPECTLHIPI